MKVVILKLSSEELVLILFVRACIPGVQCTYCATDTTIFLDSKVFLGVSNPKAQYFLASHYKKPFFSILIALIVNKQTISAYLEPICLLPQWLLLAGQTRNIFLTSHLQSVKRMITMTFSQIVWWNMHNLKTLRVFSKNILIWEVLHILYLSVAF